MISVIQTVYGINNSLNFDRYLYGNFNPGLEIYHDYYDYYVPQMVDLSKGLIPYRDFGYSYPPLFLYSLYPLYLIGGSSAASVPIWLSDAATVPLIYLFALRYTSQKLSLVVGISYAFSPFFLLYEGYLWFSSQPMTFFMVLGIYFLFTKRFVWSAAIFAVSVLFKQEAILLLPIYILMYARNCPPKTTFKALTIIISIILAASLPFLLISSPVYLNSMTYGLVDRSATSPSVTGSLVSTSVLAKSAFTNQSFGCNTISSTWRSLVCTYGNFTYTDAKLIPHWTVVFSWPFMNQVSLFCFFPVAAAVIYNLIRLRKDNVVPLLWCSLILTIFLGLFDLQVHSIYRYYFIPCYVFPLICSRSRLVTTFAIFFPLLSLVFPSGDIQLMFPLFDILAVLLFNQRISSLPDSATISSSANAPSLLN
jgi:hypothetical protein